jgi:hypothetical protein
LLYKFKIHPGDYAKVILNVDAAFLIFNFLFQPTISLEMPVPSQGHYGVHSVPVGD